MSRAEHVWREADAREYPGSNWTLFVCDECGSSFQTEYFPSGEPCPEREAVSPLSETVA